MSIVTVTKDNFKEEVLEAKGKVLLDFWAPWCGPCRMIAPMVDAIAAENGDIKVGKVNVDEEQELAQEFEIMSIPTLILFKDGKLVDRSVGVIPKPLIQRFVNQ